MKTLCILFASLVVLTTANAQVQFAVKAGISPTRTMGTAPVIVNRNDISSDFLFNGSKVEYSPAIGLAMRIDKERFFFEGEATYYSIRKTYGMQYINESISIENMQHMEESCKSIELPLSLGVKLGRVEITSGFSARYEFGQNSSLAQMHGFRRQVSSMVYGFHSGAGIKLGKISAQLRYQQEFSNYGEGIFVNDHELLLRNSPTQIRFIVGLWF